MNWIDIKGQPPPVLETPMDRTPENALLLYTPVDGMVRVGWCIEDRIYNPRPQFITTNSRTAYQRLTARVSHWMHVPKPPQ